MAAHPPICDDLKETGNVLDFTYSFNVGTPSVPLNNGNVASIANNRNTNRSQSFTYDELSRIKTAQSAAASGGDCWGLQFGYDVWANLLSASVTKCSAPMLNLGVNTNNRITNSGFSYDAAGNLLTDGTNTYTWDAESRMKTVAGITYTYDGDGKRIKKSNGKLYWYGSGSDPLEETDLSGVPSADYIFFGGKRTARLDLPGAVVHYYFANHLGSATVVTNSVGVIQDESDYYPFGGERVVTDTDPNQYKFTGKERDTESGLDDFGRRYYASTYGRFLSADSVDNDFVTADPRSLNRYGYARNNPLKFIDPTGEAIELTGATDEERRKQLEAIKQSLGNKKAADLLFINKDKKGSRFFVGINGDAKDFQKLGKLEARLGEVVGSEKVVRFSLDSKVSLFEGPRNLGFVSTLLFQRTVDVGEFFSGGVTISPAASISGQIETVVDPNDIRTGATLGEVVAHEVLGEALGRIKGLPGNALHKEGLKAEQERRQRDQARQEPKPKH